MLVEPAEGVDASILLSDGKILYLFIVIKDVFSFLLFPEYYMVINLIQFIVGIWHLNMYMYIYEKFFSISKVNYI